MAVKKASTKRKNTRKKKKSGFMQTEICLLLVLAASVLIFISLIGYGGKAGTYVSGCFFGIFGLMAYIFPFLLFGVTAFAVSNKKSAVAKIKSAAWILLDFVLCAFIHLTVSGSTKVMELSEYYRISSETGKSGGLIGGAITGVFYPYFGLIGTYVIFVILMIICFVLITEKSFFKGLRKGSKKVYHSAKEDAAKRKEQNARRKKERALAMEAEQEKRKAARAMTIDHPIAQAEKPKETQKPMEEVKLSPAAKRASKKKEASSMIIEEAHEPVLEDIVIKRAEPLPEEITEPEAAAPAVRRKKTKSTSDEAALAEEHVKLEIESSKEASPSTYQFPPFRLLKKGQQKGMGDSDKHLKETAKKLQQTLENFGVKVTVTNVSCGPAVTRYELQPEMGVKVSKIVNLADDIKLNLAAADIRIEAPIPGKAAVGIEVPNKENSMVMFRNLLESKEFQNFESNIAFAVGRDIAGKVVVTDIGKMPHLLIAGATGSGKSVCINTLIMSILYKASPEDVKLIMIDPKVVELSVYNGIPHLFIPVVTDPKKAAGALNWAVAEMTDRYQKFADLNVRDLKGYNKKIESIEHLEDENKPEKMPQIVIIVDELADLMMVASGEVEDAICRLAQLARAAGIHLIIATQRPSVNVITGLIKANMPSRIAFSVSSGVDSRTIIDMNGAEKLLGKGDMLFYPQGYQKPVRVQGAFVSDQEVGDVVQFLVSQHGNPVYDEEVAEKVNKAQAGAALSSADSPGTERDVYFVEAGKLLIDKEKASIGMLQRMFKIGFNRAARLMDQLAEAGVVGEEEGTKPRKVLMSMEEFEQFIDEYV